jgi:NAD(P)-dependent dehydrogenase (short-subunit alcohol dehydrogenase family)
LALSGKRDLILHGRDATRLASVRRRCQHPERHREWTAGLADPAAAGESLSDFLRSSGLRVAHFVHCAGVASVEPIRHADPSHVAATFKVNVLSAAAIVKALLDADPLRESLRSILLVSSAASLRGENGVAVYSATKGALDALVRSLAVELAPQIRVNALLPAIVRTPMSQATLDNPAMQDVLARKYPLGTGETADLAGVTEMLTSESSRWTTGSLWTVDGGRTLF